MYITATPANMFVLVALFSIPTPISAHGQGLLVNDQVKLEHSNGAVNTMKLEVNFAICLY